MNTFEIMSLHSKSYFLLDTVRFLFSHLTADTMKVIVEIDILFANVINHQIRTMEDRLRALGLKAL